MLTAAPSIHAGTKFSRAWAMPSPETFSIQPIFDLLMRWIPPMDGPWQSVIVDPFARNSKLGTIRNDLNPSHGASYNMDARDFCQLLLDRGDKADVVLFDPPYSPRQIVECYESIGKSATTETTQNAALYSRVRDALADILNGEGIAISFGWNSSGFGKGRGFELLEILLVCHGGAHNDTIVTVERKLPGLFDDAAASSQGGKGAQP